MPGVLLVHAPAELTQGRRVAKRLEEARLCGELAELTHPGSLDISGGIRDAVDVNLLRRGQDLDLGLGRGDAAQSVAQDALGELVRSVSHGTELRRAERRTARWRSGHRDPWPCEGGRGWSYEIIDGSPASVACRVSISAFSRATAGRLLSGLGPRVSDEDLATLAGVARRDAGVRTELTALSRDHAPAHGRSGGSCSRAGPPAGSEAHCGGASLQMLLMHDACESQQSPLFSQWLPVCEHVLGSGSLQTPVSQF